MLAMLCVGMMQAQLTDTVRHRDRDYYYSHWYDTCHCFNGTDSVMDPASMAVDHIRMYSYGEYAKADYTPEPLDLLGVAVMVDHYDPMYNYFHRYIDTNYGEEYVYVAYYDSATNQMQRLDSVRWDTIQPKTMELVLTERPENYMTYGYELPEGGVAYCWVYDAYFEKPVNVVGEFFIIGSFHGSAKDDMNYFCQHKPVSYAQARSLINNGGCHHRIKQFDTDGWRWIPFPILSYAGDGPFLPIIAGQKLLEVHSADSAMGSVRGGGLYMDSTSAQIEATARYGYIFSQWNDGDTSNPRLVTVTSDTSFTAYFVPATYHRLEVNAYPPEYGTVVGSGYYPDNTDTVMVATPASELYRFVEWDDHGISNPRRVILTSDTVFTAYFEPLPTYTVTAYSNDERMGNVTGSGTYYEGTEAVISAEAREGYYFERWSDFVRENPRRIVVMQDMVISAIFKSSQAGVREAVPAGGQFALVPNPAKDEVRCETGGEGFAGGVLSVSDVTGREVLRKELPRHTSGHTLPLTGCPKGVYFVTLTTAQGSSTQKLVVEG